MRHGHGLRKLNRTSSHRLAMLQNMMNSLIEHEAIKTTVPKAKELRRVIEPMITLAKVDTVANRRLAFDRLRGMLGARFEHFDQSIEDFNGAPKSHQTHDALTHRAATWASTWYFMTA